MLRRRRASRRQVSDRARACCEHCLTQQKFSSDPFTVEHITPRCADGTDDSENLAFACNGCNGRKYTAISAIDPLTGVEVPLYNPRSHVWAEHFVWSEDATLLLGLTPTGRATIERLGLNREGVVNLRSRLARTQEHPP